MWPGLRREHDSDESDVGNVARTEARARFCGGMVRILCKNQWFREPDEEMWPGLRREHDSNESDRCDGENPMQKPMVSRA